MKKGLDQKSYTSIITRYQNAVLSVIYKMVGSWEIARDLGQDVFLKFWNHRKTIDGSRPVFTLLYRIAVNQAIDYLRQKRPTEPLLLLEGIPVSSPHSLELRELYHLIHCCSAELKPKQRAVFVLRDMEGLPFEEISAILNMPVANLRSNLHLARKKIRNLLSEKYEIREEHLYEL